MPSRRYPTHLLRLATSSALVWVLACLVLVGGGLASCAKAGGGGGGGGSDAGPGSVDADTSTPAADAQEEDPNCPGNFCSILPQCGCGTGACDLDLEVLAEGSSSCRDVAAEGTDIDTCEFLVDCAPGYVCLGGQCRAYCDGEYPCDDGHCIIRLTYDAGGGQIEEVPGLTTCTKKCSPEKGSSDNDCPGNFGCHLLNLGEPVQGDETYFADCRQAPASGGGNNASCENGDTDCRAGFECVVLGGNNVCRQTCLVGGGGGQCTNGTCSPYGTKIVIDGVEYGACI